MGFSKLVCVQFAEFFCIATQSDPDSSLLVDLCGVHSGTMEELFGEDFWRSAVQPPSWR